MEFILAKAGIQNDKSFLNKSGEVVFDDLTVFDADTFECVIKHHYHGVWSGNII